MQLLTLLYLAKEPLFHIMDILGFPNFIAIGLSFIHNLVHFPMHHVSNDNHC